MPVKSLLVTDKFAPHAGGTALIYWEWVRRMPGASMAVVTCTVPGRDWRAVDRALAARVVRVPFLNVPKLRMPLCWLLVFLATPWAIFRERPGMLHAGQPLETGWIVWFWGHVFRVPYALHGFGDEVAIYWRRRWSGAAMRFLARRAAAIGVISRFSRDRLVALGLPVDRVRIVYPGVSDVHVPTGERRAHSGGPVLLTVSRLVRRKGHDRVIAALPRVLDRYPSARYVVVGAGPEERALRRAAADCGVQDAVEFAGAASYEQTAAYYESADVFVHPNRELPNGDVEGFGIVFLEAGAHGLPVVGGRSGGAPDAVVDGETGFLVDPEDTAEIAERILQILDDGDLRRRMAEAGRRRSRSFTWDAAAAQVTEMTERAA